MDLLNEDILDEADREGIIEKIVEFNEKIDDNSQRGVENLFDNYDHNIPITVGVILLISISSYFNNLFGLGLFSLLVITLFGIPFFINNYLKKNVRKLFDCIKNMKVLIKNDCLKLLKRREVLLFAFKYSKLNNLPNKKLRSSCLISLRKLVWMLILENKNQFTYQEKNKVMMVDLINENMIELCGKENNIIKVDDEHLDTMSLSTLLQFLSLCESEFLSFMFFEVYEIISMKSRNNNTFRCWLDIWKIGSIVKEVVTTYKKEHSLLTHLYSEANKFDFTRNVAKEKAPTNIVDMTSNKTIVNNLVGLLAEEINQLNENNIIGNKTLLEMARNLYNFLDNTNINKVEPKKVKNELKSEFVDESPTIIREKIEPAYEVYENDPMVNDEEYSVFNDIPELDEDILRQHKMLLNELERPLQRQRQMHEEMEYNVLAKKRGITVDELKEIFKNEQMEEEKSKQQIKSDKINISINPPAQEINTSLMEELKKQYFFNKSFVNDEIIFGDDDD